MTRRSPPSSGRQRCIAKVFDTAGGAWRCNAGARFRAPTEEYHEPEDLRRLRLPAGRERDRGQDRGTDRRGLLRGLRDQVAGGACRRDLTARGGGDSPVTSQADLARTFLALHVPGNPVILFNAWDAGSARAVADAGAKAIATGSWSVAAAHGYEGGERIPWNWQWPTCGGWWRRCRCRSRWTWRAATAVRPGWSPTRWPRRSRRARSAATSRTVSRPTAA